MAKAYKTLTVYLYIYEKSLTHPFLTFKFKTNPKFNI